MGPNEKPDSGTDGDRLPPAKSLESDGQTGSKSDGGGELVRLFIALKLPGKIVKQVSRLSDDLKKGFGFTACRPSWVDPEAMHLTLRFLGQTETKRIDVLKEDVSQIAKTHSPPNLRVMGLDVFPDWRRPRILWVGVKDKTESLVRLQGDLESLCVQRGFEPEGRPYHPHLTLARFRGMKGIDAAKGIIAGQQRFRSERFAPAELILFESQSTRDGVKYCPLVRCPLG